MRIEKEVLSYLINNQKKIHEAREYLSSKSFQENQSKRIFNALCSLKHENKEIDEFSILDFDDKIIEQDLSEVLESYKTTNKNFTSHLKIIRSKHQKNELSLLAQKILQNKDEDNVEVLLATLKTDIEAISEKGNSFDSRTFESFAEELSKDLVEGRNGKGEAYLHLGIKQLIGQYSFKQGQLIVLGARPGMGKTALLVSAFDYFSKNKKNPLLFSIEMTSKELIKRMYSKYSELSISELDQYHITDEQIKLAEENSIKGNKDIIDNVNTLEVIESITHKKAAKGCKIVMIDYLTLMQLQSRSESERHKIGEITRRLKMLAKETSTTIILLSQLSRANESRDDKRPILSDLRESGTIEQDADSVLFLHRPNYYGVLEDENGESTEYKAELIVGKNRHGKTGAYEITFIPELTCFPTEIDTHLKNY